MGDRPAHPHIGERALLVVHGEDGLALGRADGHGKARIGCQHRQVLGRLEVREGVDIAGHQRGELRRRIGDDAEGRAIKLRRLAPVFGILGQLDAVALHPLHQLERSGADGLGGVGRGGLLSHHRRIAPAQIEQERAVRLLERDLERRRIDDLDVLDALEQRLLRIGAELAARPVERELGIVGVEIGAVVELHALLEVERVGQPVFRNLPALGEPGLHRAFRIDAGQAFEDVGVGDLVDGSGRARRRVEMRRLEPDADIDVGADRLRARRSERGGCRQHRRKGGGEHAAPGETSSHA